MYGQPAMYLYALIRAGERGTTKSLVEKAYSLADEMEKERKRREAREEVKRMRERIRKERNAFYEKKKAAGISNRKLAKDADLPLKVVESYARKRKPVDCSAWQYNRMIQVLDKALREVKND